MGVSTDLSILMSDVFVSNVHLSSISRRLGVTLCLYLLWYGYEGQVCKIVASENVFLVEM